MIGARSQTPELDRFLLQHRRTCTYWIFSGDRHCSCGRDLALRELDQLKGTRRAPVSNLIKKGRRRLAMPLQPVLI